MNQKSKLKFIQNTLDSFYPDPPIPLLHKDAYTLLIAVVLSAQCTDARVNTVTPVLFAQADTPDEMSKLPISKIEEIIHKCGFFRQKAKSIANLSKALVDKYDSIVPSSFEELEKLPGVGHKTASVIMSQVFGIPAFPVDTHIHRLAQRWGLSDGSSVEQTEKDLKRVFVPEKWNKLHLQIIYFGREYCKARGHSIEKCPICSQL